MTSPLVSVILAVYNGEKYLKESIASILNQTHQEIQLIVVDDGSTDSTAEIIHTFSDPRIEYYRLEYNSHIAYATNYGFSKMRGDYMAIMDSDDIWYPRKLEKQLAYLAAHPEHAGCFTWVDLIDENGESANEELYTLQALYSSSTESREYWLRFFFFIGNRLNNPSSLIRADACRAVGAHNLFYIQATDMEWWVRFTKKFSFGILEEPLIRYRRFLHSQKSISSRSAEKDTRFFNEHMYIRYHFFEELDDELFISAFQEYFRNPGARTQEELELEKTFLLVYPIRDSIAYSALGLLKLEECLGNPETAAVLKEQYGFSTHECGTYTGTHILNDPVTQNLTAKAHNTADDLRLSQMKLYEAESRIQKLKDEIEDLKLALSSKKLK